MLYVYPILTTKLGFKVSKKHNKSYVDVNMVTMRKKFEMKCVHCGGEGIHVKLNI